METLLENRNAPSLHLHIPPWHDICSPQSVFVLQLLITPHAGHSPPQSISDSPALITPSVHVPFVGPDVGLLEGAGVGLKDGTAVGLDDGDRVGAVGGGVGA